MIPQRALVMLILAILAPGAAAQRCAGGQVPVEIAAIRFEGDRVTLRSTFMQELDFAEGDIVCPERIAAGRQAILDLRLFRKVHAETEVVAPGRVAVTYHVDERWYVLPVPRIDASSDAEFGYGVKLTWNNVAGLNHRLKLNAVRRELKERTTDDETIVNGSYLWRRFAGSANNVVIAGEHREESAIDRGRAFEEREDSFGIGVSRQLTSLRTGQGWSARARLGWRYGTKVGQDPPPDDGLLTVFGVGAAYRDLHSDVYSERGVDASVSLGTQVPGLSDYDQFLVVGEIARLLPVGSRAHQTVILIAEAGSYHGGPEARRNDHFQLGGAEAMRGYEQETAEGDTYWRVAAEYLRPLRWDWLRGLVVLEVGDTVRSSFDDRETPMLASLGLGLRIRFTWFVDAEIEFGAALPLVDGEGARFFAGGTS